MFLNQLPTRLHKALFLELAMLVMMASHDDDASEQISEFTSDEVLKKFLASISSKEAEMLQEYQNELFKSDKNDIDFNSDFIELSLNQQYRAFDSSLNASSFYNPEPDESYAGDDAERNEAIGVVTIKPTFSFSRPSVFSLFGDDSERKDACVSQLLNHLNISRDSEKKFPTFWWVLDNAIDDILGKYANDADIKQEVMQYLISKGEDILTLTPTKIRASMASLPQIKQEILQKAVQTVFTLKVAIGLTLSEREKKIILCELIGAAYSSGAFETEEKQLINTICQVCSFDSEYIEEFDTVMSTLFKVNKELAELINE
jgi:hypothetical protein